MQILPFTLQEKESKLWSLPDTLLHGLCHSHHFSRPHLQYRKGPTDLRYRQLSLRCLNRYDLARRWNAGNFIKRRLLFLHGVLKERIRVDIWAGRRTCISDEGSRIYSCINHTKNIKFAAGKSRVSLNLKWSKKETNNPQKTCRFMIHNLLF